MNTKTLGAIIFWCGVLLLAYLVVIMAIAEHSQTSQKIIVDCYDAHDNTITGLQCEETSLDLPAWFWCVLIFGLIVMVTGELLYLFNSGFE